MRSEIRFLLNGKAQHVRDVAGDVTLLEWLRGQPHLRGTKQGCAEGDCGACTVTMARPDAMGRLEYRPVNSCILFLGMIDGSAIRTVEGLASPDGKLHPVQSAMVAADASQCGFCTPGFVMSLYAAWQNGRGLSANEVDTTLAGNLCRCTGYRPIVDAASMLDHGRDGDMAKRSIWQMRPRCWRRYRRQKTTKTISVLVMQPHNLLPLPPVPALQKSTPKRRMQPLLAAQPILGFG